MKRSRRQAAGYSLVELLTALAIFLVICAVAFGLLTMAMKRYQSNSQVLNAFQEARFGLDQIVRDINDSGYPPKSNFQSLPANASLYAVSPIAWSQAQGYPSSTCSIGSCTTPGDFDLILETKVDPLNSAASVKWIRYQLQGSTLMRAIVDKPSGGGDPDAATQSNLVPYVQNVMNNASASQIASFQVVYPGMYSGGIPVPIFEYTCDTPIKPYNCTAAEAVGSNSPEDVRSISVTLIVMAPFPDAQTGQPRLVELRGRGRRVNPTD